MICGLIRSKEYTGTGQDVKMDAELGRGGKEVIA